MCTLNEHITQMYNLDVYGNSPHKKQKSGEEGGSLALLHCNNIKVTAVTVLNEFSSLLTTVCAMSPTAITRLSLYHTTSHNLPTHNKGHILDFICCTDITPTNLFITDFPISYHTAVLFDIHIQSRNNGSSPSETSIVSTPHISPP